MIDTAPAPVVAQPKTAKLSDLLESCDRSQLKPGLLHDKEGAFCALGMGYEHGSGSWDDISDFENFLVASPENLKPSFFETMLKDWGLNVEQCRRVQETFDCTCTGYNLDTAVKTTVKLLREWGL